MATLRLNKYLAQAGIASRRRADALIAGGEVEVNGKVVSELGVQVDPENDHIRVSGKHIVWKPSAAVVFLMYKPRNVMVTKSDPEGRPTVFDIMKNQGKGLVHVGRLDFDTEGLLLLTNDGDLAYQLTHPKLEIPRVYHVKVKSVPEDKNLLRLRKGLRVGGVMLKPLKVEIMKVGDANAWLEMILTEGKNRQVREMCQYIGHPVSKLKRVSFGPIRLSPSMLPGDVRKLTAAELIDLRDYLDRKKEQQRTRPARSKTKQTKKTAKPASRPPRSSGTTRPSRGAPARRSR